MALMFGDAVGVIVHDAAFHVIARGADPICPLQRATIHNSFKSNKPSLAILLSINFLNRETFKATRNQSKTSFFEFFPNIL